ncbi:E3 ubiquitin-protein ligase RNF166-like [Topomyia yanbarensis]|uniref:E3 ubiquitin-protein ligase RNF166-like n=1 Tax=Topomyia yanbarensis TaxID=2498891 RepID=UPI00273BF445|nr:E3 ubiquitin-protein ligase RNF166-like [Topomyia yanbarensis]
MSFPADPDQEEIVVSSRKSDTSCCSDSLSRNRYNLRNRGPATFLLMAERECPICLSEVFEKPVIVNCGHTFCGKCIRLSLGKFKNCPICNQILIEQLFLNDTSYTKRLTIKDRSPLPTYPRQSKRNTTVNPKISKQGNDALAENQITPKRKAHPPKVASEPIGNMFKRTRF